MLQPDRQRLEHIRDYCIEIKKTITDETEEKVKAYYATDEVA